MIESMTYVAIEKKRVAGKPAVLVAIHSPDPEKKQEVLEYPAQRFTLTRYKKGPYIVEGANSVPPIRQYIEERFPDARFVSMVEIEVLGG